MNARNQLKDTIKSFLDPNNGMKVLLIKGDWGVGKSFAINEILNEIKTKDPRRIAITTLFGSKSISECIDKINFLSLTNKITENKTNIFQKIKAFIPKDLNIGAPGAKVQIGLSQIFNSIITHQLKDGVLVFDDIERKDPNFNLSEIFANISYLAENILGKTIIVFSEKNLSEDDLKSLKTLREKVIDIEVEFSPTSHENTEIIFLNQIFTSLVKKYNIRNIRILKKIAYNLKILIDGFKFENEIVKNSLAEAVIFLSHFHYNNTTQFSITDFPNLINWYYEKEDKEKKEFALEIQKSGYHFDETELPIIEFLTTGILNTTNWTNSIQTLNKHTEKQELKEARQKIWESFNGNFQKSYSDVINDVTHFLNQYSDKLYPNEILEFQNLLSDLKFTNINTTWLKNSIHTHIENLDIKEIQSLKELITDEETAHILSATSESKTYKPTLEIAISKVVYDGGWHNEDSYIIQNASKADFMEWYKNSKDEHLLSLLRSTHKMFCDFGGAYTQAAQNLIDSAYEFAEATPDENDRRLNQLRISTFLKRPSETNQ